MRIATGGIVIALMVVVTLISDMTEYRLPLSAGGLLGWVAIGFLFVDVKRSLQWQTVVITVVGVVLLLTTTPDNNSAQWIQAMSSNAALVSMLASVGFLRLVALPVDKTNNKPLPVGFGAFVKTLAGVSLFGSVINISAPVLFADRLHQHNALSRLASQSITRIFTSTASWSPFFGGMAAVLTVVPDMRLSFVILTCLPFAVISFIVVVCEVRWRHTVAVSHFRGYPVNFYNLWIPAVLALTIIALSRVVPGWSVLTHISLAAVLLTVVVLLVRNGVSDTANILWRFVVNDLPATINELQLFLAAGVLAAGLVAMISGELLFEFIPVISGFSAFAAALLLGAMILLAVVGVHPVVTVSSATPLLMTLGPDPDLLAVCYLLAWSLGTCASPLSGTHLVFQGRYQIPSWKGALWNWPYVAVMYIFAVALMYWVSYRLSMQ